MLANKRNNPNYTYTSLPYELRNYNSSTTTTLYMEYIVGFNTDPGDFSANKINLLSDRLLYYESEYFNGLEVVSDTESK